MPRKRKDRRVDKGKDVCYNPATSSPEMTIKDPLDLQDAEIKRYKQEIINTLMKFGKPEAEARKSAERWQESLLESKRQFGMFQAVK